jgi:predicted PurR-regulated permease PerM
VPTDRAERKSLILWTIAMTALAVIVVWCAYLVRDVLLLVYVSGLFAIGFSPVVRLIERQKALPLEHVDCPGGSRSLFCTCLLSARSLVSAS